MGAGRVSFLTSCALRASPFGLSCVPVGPPHSMVAQLQRPVSQENHAEATLRFVTQLKSQNIAFASSSLPGLEERKHGRSVSPGEERQCPTIRTRGIKNMAVVLSGTCNLSD